MFYVGLILVCILGGFVQTVVGFGSAVALLIYLTNFMPISEAPSVSAVVCLVLNLTIVLQGRRAIRLKPILWPTVIYSAVSLAAVFLVRSFHVAALSILFGVFLICLSFYYLFFSKKLQVRPETGMMLASSSVSGLFAGLFSIGGPTLSLYYLSICGTGECFVVSLQLSFLVTNIVLCCGRVANRLLTVSMLPVIAGGIVGTFAGQLLGSRIRDRLSTKLLSILVYAAVGLSGLVVILQQIF